MAEVYDQYGRDGAKFAILKAEGEAIEAAFGLSPASCEFKPVLQINKLGKDYRARNVARAVSKQDEPRVEATLSGLVVDLDKYYGCLGKPFSLTVPLPDGAGGVVDVARVFFVDEIGTPQTSEEFLNGSITCSSDPDIDATPV